MPEAEWAGPCESRALPPGAGHQRPLVPRWGHPDHRGPELLLSRG